MKKEWLSIASIYVGTVIGAGFASGREIIEFFGVYGINGIWGMFIVGIILSLIGSLLLIKIYNNKIRSCRAYIKTYRKLYYVGRSRAFFFYDLTRQTIVSCR
ncbi:hypothetical protein RBU61_17550 [Tissierella sp. MB52-C2]|uniref:hypothetical protein n=1 Tax=Tissierella sp. MB52-C2 TaxID=3070999 RepID=UPI00280A4D71|nr:hypothetical protein [Tissierella sp. MB52-C2]WMM24710.1 hypothetical protein RBU61_17550 [Tissierella sp. MB52-C2]